MLRFLFENIRCARHNFKSLKKFSLHYWAGRWIVRDGSVSMKFDHYPFLAFFEIEGYLQKWREPFGPGSVVIDAGSCKGEFSVYAAKKVGANGRVVVMEPDPASMEETKRSIQLNDCSAQCTFLEKGLWDSPATLKFKAGFSSCSKVVIGTDESEQGVITIETESLVSLVASEKLERLDFVKMDIEGAEIQAVSVLNSLPLGMRPRFSIASYHIVDGTKTALVLESMLSELGYSNCTGNASHLTTYGSQDGFDY